MESHLQLSLVLTTSFLLFSLTATPTMAARPARASPVEFIRTSCTRTTFPRLCVSSLTSYASRIQTSPTQLASTALAISLAGAKSTSATIANMSHTTPGMRPIKVQTMRDCVENVRGSVKELRRSVSEMSHLGGQRLGFQISNIQTWVSAALTDANTCMDGFAGRSMDGALKSKVRAQILHLAQLTSNALSLVNGLVI